MAKLSAALCLAVVLSLCAHVHGRRGGSTGGRGGSTSSRGGSTSRTGGSTSRTGGSTSGTSGTSSISRTSGTSATGPSSRTSTGTGTGLSGSTPTRTGTGLTGSTATRTGTGLTGSTATRTATGLSGSTNTATRTNTGSSQSSSRSSTLANAARRLVASNGNKYAPTGTGSKSKTRSVVSNVAKAAAAYVAIKQGKKVLKAGHISFPFGGRSYYMSPAYYRNRYHDSSSSSSSEEEDVQMCEYRVTQTDTDLWNIWLDDNNRVTIVAFECPVDRLCCGMECCDPQALIAVRHNRSASSTPGVSAALTALTALAVYMRL